MATTSNSKLVGVVRIYIELTRGMAALGVLLMPVVLAVVLPRLDDAGRVALDLPIVMNFRLATPAAGPEFPSLEDPPRLRSGQGELRVHARSRALWIESLVFFEAIFVALFYGFTQMRAVVRNVLEDEPFLPENALRIRRVGWTITGWSVMSPLAHEQSLTI